MKRKASVWILAAAFAAALACDSMPFLPATPTASAAPTATPTPTLPPTKTSTATLTAYPTRTDLPTLIPGIEEPVAVGDADLLVANALRRDTFRCGDDSEPVADPEVEEFLLVLLTVVKGPVLTPKLVDNWLSKNGIDRIGIATSAEEFLPIHGHCFAQNPENLVLTEIHLAFLVGRGSSGFRLILPRDVEIPLDSFLP